MNDELQKLADRLEEATRGDTKFKVKVYNLEDHDKRFSGIGTIQGSFEATWDITQEQLDLLEREAYRGSIRIEMLS